jgi:hypothetical protein
MVVLQVTNRASTSGVRCAKAFPCDQTPSTELQTNSTINWLRLPWVTIDYTQNTQTFVRAPSLFITFTAWSNDTRPEIAKLAYEKRERLGDSIRLFLLRGHNGGFAFTKTNYRKGYHLLSMLSYSSSSFKHLRFINNRKRDAELSQSNRDWIDGPLYARVVYGYSTYKHRGHELDTSATFFKHRQDHRRVANTSNLGSHIIFPTATTA